MESDAPILISRYDQVLEQIQLLVKEIEEFKMDSGVVVMMRNGLADIRGLGETHSATAASAILFMAYKSLPPATQSDMLYELGQLVERSKAIEIEAPWWRSTPNLHQPPGNPHQ